MMSTSDAAESVLRAETPQHGTARARTAAARGQQDESDESATRRQSYPSASTQEAAHTARTLSEDSGRPEASPPRGSNCQTQQPVRPRFTSCFFLRLRTNQNPDLGLHSLRQTAETDNSCCQINGQPSQPDSSVKVFSDSSSGKGRFTSTKEENSLTVISNELKTPRDLSINHSFSNGESGPHECKSLHIVPCGSQTKTCSESVLLEDNIKHQTKRDKEIDPVELSSPSRSMLSSSVVTVLAPHWNGRLRRMKRFEGINHSEAQGSLQDVTNTATNRTHECFQETANWSLTDGLQEQVRVPFPGTRRNTEGWSTKSGPASLGYESKRKMIHTVSLDTNYERMDNRKMDAGVLSPVATTASSISPLSLDPHDQRRNPQTFNQGGQSSLSSKPTTSSLLLTLRRFNSNSRISSAASSLSEINPASSDHKGKSFPTLLSQAIHDNNDQDKSKPLLSPSSISCKKTETGPLLSRPSSNHRETRFISTSSQNKDAEDVPFTQPPQTITRAQSSLLSSKKASLTRGQTERHRNLRGSDTNLFSESSVSSPKHSYDHSACLPRRTTLTSTSWWKKVSQEGSSPLKLNNSTLIKGKLNTPFAPPSNNNGDLATASPTDIKRYNSQIANNRDNNNTTESLCKGNINLVMKPEGGSPNHKQRISEDSPEHESGKLVKQQKESNSNNREPQTPHSLPDVFPGSKISRASAQTTLSHPKDLSKHDVSDTSCTANITELQPTLQNPDNAKAPTESCSKYKNNQCAFKTNKTPTSSHSKDSTKPCLSLSTTNTLNSQALASKSPSSFHLANTKSNSAFHLNPVSSQNNIHAPSYTDCSSQTSKFTMTMNTTPLGFKESYDCVPKPFYPKAASSLIPTIKTFSKADNSPGSTASATSFSPTAIPPATTTAPSTSFFTPPVSFALTSSSTPITISSLLTPPSTPIITSPISDSSSPQEEGAFLSRQERDPKKKHLEGKRIRQVTWEESVDLKHSEPIAVEKEEPSQVPTSALSSSRSLPSIKAPSIFSFLRSSSPTKNTYAVCSTTTKTSSIQVMKGGKYRSLSSDSADSTSRELRHGDPLIFDQGKQEVTEPGQERTLSVESGTVQCGSSAPLSLPPDFSSGYKLRYSSPPYSTLVSTRSTQGETKPITSRSQLFHKSSNYSPHFSKHTDPAAAMTLSKPPLSPISLPRPPALSFLNKTATQDSSKCGISETDQVNSHDGKNNSRNRQNSQILLVNNRVHVGSHSLRDAKAQVSSPTCVTETLVYSIKSKVHTTAPKNCTPEPLQHTANTPKHSKIPVSVETRLSQQSHMVQSKEVPDEPGSHSAQSSSGGSSTDSQPPDDGRRKTKDSVLCKSRIFSGESNNEQCPKRSRFALKKSVSTPNSSLSRSESEQANKTNNKMDQVFNRLRQTFSTRRSDDEISFPWKWRRAFQTPSVSGSSDISNVSNVPAESTITSEEPEQEKGMVLKDIEKETEETKRWTHDRYTIIPPPTSGDLQNACSEHVPENKIKPNLTIQSPPVPQFKFCTDNRTDYNPTNQLPSCRDPSPESVHYPPQFRKSTPSPRSPFSPFSSLSPLSPFPSPNVTDDSVFYSPQLQRRRESPLPCEPGEGITMRGSKRSRASTGPPSAGPGQDKDSLASSYADLKYGIEPGRSFSVSSVLSCRPSGPGRISTGSRFMSVGDLSEPSLTCGGTGRDLDQWSVSPDWTKEYDALARKDCLMSYYPSDPGKMRTRSLPRSLTRRLANWSSGVSDSGSVTATASKPARLWSPNMNTCHFAWDTEGPPTPPPTPPLSPVSRRMSKPPSMSSPTHPSSSGAQQVDSPSSKGHLPSRGYISSLSTFEESSDSSSDTTTDDEYYLGTGEDEKETEL